VVFRHQTIRDLFPLHEPFAVLQVGGVNMHRKFIIVLALLAIFAANPQRLFAQSELSEFTDNEYDYAFRYPSSWKMRPPPPKGADDIGEVRVFIGGPRAALTVTVGHHGKNLSEAAYRSNPNSDQIINSLIEITIEQLYKKMSRTLNASRMSVLERKALDSNKGIRFYISTIHFIDGKPPIVVVGTHLQPFDKPYGIAFVMNVIADKKMKDDQKLYNDIFNSFHLLGEQPVTR
jgi:hypothetical protein